MFRVTLFTIAKTWKQCVIDKRNILHSYENVYTYMKNMSDSKTMPSAKTIA